MCACISPPSPLHSQADAIAFLRMPVPPHDVADVVLVLLLPPCPVLQLLLATAKSHYQGSRLQRVTQKEETTAQEQ